MATLQGYGATIGCFLDDCMSSDKLGSLWSGVEFPLPITKAHHFGLTLSYDGEALGRQGGFPRPPKIGKSGRGSERSECLQIQNSHQMQLGFNEVCFTYCIYI